MLSFPLLLLLLQLLTVSWLQSAAGLVALPPRGSALEGLDYVCLESKLSSNRSGPFTTGLLLHKSDTGEGSYSSIGAALQEEWPLDSIGDITILKDGTLCFKPESGDKKSGEAFLDDANLGTGNQHGRKLLQERDVSVGDAEVQLDGEQDVRVNETVSSNYPFSAIGFLENGCTGSLIGRCHVLTAGHCVLHPSDFQYSRELKFTPGLNSADAQGPYGTFDFGDVKVAQRWAIFSDPAQDIALIHIKGIGRLVDEKLGYLHIGDGGQSQRLVNLNLAGYPEDKQKGHMWYDFCSAIPFGYGMRRFINHSCRVEKGNSGSPLWVYNKWTGDRQTRALHVAELTYGRIRDNDIEEVLESSPQAVILSGDLLEEVKSWMNNMHCT